MAVTRDQVAAIYVATFNRAPLAAGLDYWTSSDFTIEKIAKSFFDQPEAKAIYTDDGEAISSEQFVIRIFDNLFNRLPLTAGLDYWADALDSGAVSQGEMILAVINGATGDDATILANKTEAGLHYADNGGKATDYSLANIDETDQSLANALAAIDAALEEDFVLTVNADNLTGSGAGDLVTAPVLQNQTGSGQLANTFETGDILDGGDGTDVLRADLIETGSISDTNASPAISATTSSIEQVYLRQQNPQSDTLPGNGSTIDAEKMADVEQWWSDNSRSDIQIEDIRSATEETTFGMRLTDPRVNFTNYFNALFLEGDVDSGVSSFSFVIAETGNAAAEIANINVIAIRFEYQGQAYSLDSADVAAADTWADLATALQADINADPALAGLTVSHVGGGIFNVIDASAGVFTIDPSGTVVTASTVNETKDATPGLIAPEEGPTITNIVLDGAGNGSQGGDLTIGAMSGLRGVEVFDVDVDRDSHLTVMQSTNRLAPNNGDPNEFLQVVNLNSIGAEGDLQIGSRTANLDGRAALSVDGNASGSVTDSGLDILSGLYNVVEVNGADFAGNLNVAIALDNNTIGRYLDSATEAVNFTYTAGVGDDIFNIADLSTGGAVSSDEDFAMDVQMSAGDDILIINVGTVNAVNVDGGEGENTIKVAQSHGTIADNTFAEFANFQTYEVEGTGNNAVNNTSHNFDSMTGIENVIIATDGNTAVGGLPTVGDNTQLVNLEEDQDVTVSGKNQTIGNNSTADQLFGIVTLTNDTGADRTVTLENTARLSNTTEGIRTDGVLTVTQLVINENVLPLFPGTSATTDLTVDSAGARNVANAVAAFNGQDVETLELVGTQDLTFNVAEIANQAAATGVTVSTALDIDASELTGELNLAVTGAMIGNWGTATGLTDRIVGTDGDNDTLMLWGAQGNDPVTVTEFETIQFGSADLTMFGDLNITPVFGSAIDATGIYDAKNTIATSFVIADDIAGNTALTLNNLGTGVTVDMGDANRDAFGNVVNSQFFDDAITLNSGAVAGTPAAQVTVDYLSNIAGGSAHTLTVGTVGAAAGDDTNGYQTINIDVAHAGNLTAATGVSIGADNRFMNLTLTEDSRVLDLSGGADNSGFRDTMTFGVQLPNALNKVDISDYEGDVTFTMQQGDFLTAGTALAQTDVRFVMSEDDANITLSDMDGSLAAATGVQHNSVFEFTAAKTKTDVSEWVITNVVGASQAAASIDNITRFDVSDLGITSFDQISIDTVDYTGGGVVAGTFYIRSEAQDDASTLTAVNQNTWEIEVVGLIGLAAGDLTEDNFIFA